MATHGARAAARFYENMVDSGQYHPAETIIGLGGGGATAAATTVCIATTNFRWEGITVALRATGVFCKLASLALRCP